MSRHPMPALLVLLAPCLHACGEPEEATRVELSVVVDGGGLSEVVSDLGYRITLREARMMAEDLTFAIAGELHESSLWQRLGDGLMSRAHAHPGHLQAGEITGELRGRYALDFVSGRDQQLGTATLLTGTYRSANFTFARATVDDGLADDDPLLGHSALLSGEAERDGSTTQFTLLLDAPQGRALVGAPFDFEARGTSTERLGIRLNLQDPLEGDTLFDGVDFARFELDAEGLVKIDGQASDAALVGAYNLLRRTFQTHDHFEVRASQPN